MLSGGVVADIANPTVRQVIRTGDIDGLSFLSSDGGVASGSPKSITQVIRNHEYILIVVVNTDAQGCTLSRVEMAHLEEHGQLTREVATCCVVFL